MELRLLTREEAKNVYNTLMVNDFPKNELKPLDKILLMLDENRYYSFGIYEAEEFCGYAYVVKDARIFMLDYYAVVKEKRGSGVGSKALGLLKEALKDSADILVFESENPEFAINEKEKKVQENRIAFYLKNGCTDTGVKANTFLAEYNVFTLINVNENADEEEIKDAYSKIYLSMLTKESYDKYVKIH